MKVARLVIDQKKYISIFQLALGILMLSFTLLRYFFEAPTTINIITSIFLSIQGLSSIFLGSNFRKILFEVENGLLKIRWNHEIKKIILNTDNISEISIRNSYLFIKPLQGDKYKHRIDFLKSPNREALIDFFQTNFPDRLRLHQAAS